MRVPGIHPAPGASRRPPRKGEGTVNPCARRAEAGAFLDEHFGDAIVGFGGDLQLAAFGRFRCLRHDRHDRACARGRHRLGHRAVARELLQVHARGEHQRARAGLGVAQGLLRRDPEAFHRLAAVVRAELGHRRGDQEEMRVEALRHDLRRDPVGERHHQVGGQHQVFLAHDVDERGLALEQRRAVGLDQAVRRIGVDDLVACRGGAPA